MPLGQGIVVGLTRGAEGLFDGVHVPDYRGHAAASGMRAATVASGGTARGSVTIEQHISRTDPDPFQLLQEAKFAADGTFG
jgi:hypothetical protein